MRKPDSELEEVTTFSEIENQAKFRINMHKHDTNILTKRLAIYLELALKEIDLLRKQKDG